MHAVREKIIAILAEQAMVDPADIFDETSPEELGLDSLAIVEVVFGIEETFDVSVPYNANDPAASELDLSSVGTIVAAVSRLVMQKERV